MTRLEKLSIAADIWVEFLEQKVSKEQGGLQTISPPAFNNWLDYEAKKAGEDGTNI